MSGFDEEVVIPDRIHRSHEDQDDDDFSMSSYDGDQTDSLTIKPPQPNIQRKEKRDKRDKRDRHRHKGERHKDRHRSREHPNNHEERRRDHRRHRERDPERRETRRHDKHRDRSGKHERNPNDLRNKNDKERQIHERDPERRREKVREEVYIDERDIYEIKHNREYLHSRGQMGHHRDRRQEEKMQAHFHMDPMLSPGEVAEKEKRMERFMVAEKQKEMSQREADQRRQKREEERMKDSRHRATVSMMKNSAKNFTPPYDQMKPKKRKKDHREEISEPDVELIESDEELNEYVEEIDEKPMKEKNRKKKKRKKDEEEEEIEEEEEEMVLEMNEEEQLESKRSSSISLPTSGDDGSLPCVITDSESSSNSGESDQEDEEVEDAEKKDETPVKSGDEKRENESNSGSSTEEEEEDSSEEEKEKNDESEGGSENENDGALESSVKSPVELKEDLPTYLPAIMGCRSVDEFECLNRIAEGTYGVVYRAREKATNIIVALKRLKMEKEKEGFPITSLREVNTLLKGQHENIVTVREIVVGSNMDKIYIVMDYVEHDLKSLMETMSKKKQAFTIGEVKTLMIQLLRAIHHLHDNWILHRDLKTSNLLLSHRGVLKVGDFGLAREYGSPLKQYTPIVVTLWYRAPELLLGEKLYSCPIDVWSVGCIFGELLNMEPMFPGKSEIDELNKIFKELGTPSDRIWPGYSQLPIIKKTQFATYPYNHLKERFKSRLSTEGFNLINSFLTYNPAKRITCSDALVHNYFRVEDPAPIDPAMFPTWPAKSEHPQGIIKKAPSPKPPSGGKNFKALGDGEDETIAGFFLGGPPGAGPGFTLKF